jgi:dolichyl-phosphate beta-glucosyltransferase
MGTDISIVVPCYNESNRFNFDYFEDLTKIKKTRWIFVNDGSSDQTSEILKAFCNKPNTLYLELPTNRGKSHAIAHGVKYILSLNDKTTWIGFLDSDGAFAIEDIKRMLTLTNKSINRNFDAFYSSRVKLSGRKVFRSTSRHFIGRAISTLFGLFWQEIPYDTQSGFKVYKAKMLTFQIFLKPFVTKWFFDIELHLRVLISTKNKFSVWEEPLNVWKDIPDSRINGREKIKLIIEIIKVLKLLFNHKRID